MHHPRNLRIVRAAFLLLLSAAAGIGGATALYDTGIVGVTRKSNHVFAEPGCFCHGDLPSDSVHVWITGPDSLAAGESALFSIHVAKDSSIAAGFNVAAVLGSLGIAETSATQLMQPAPADSAELTHLMPRDAAGHDTIAWQFYYRAPASPGVTDTLFANGNSVNLSDDPEGDRWAFAPEHLVHVQSSLWVSPGAPPAGFRLFQNYPNPFNPSTTIRFSLAAASFVDLSVFDVAGRQVARIVHERLEPGDHVAVWAVAPGNGGAGTASGLYICRLLVTPAGDGAGNTIRFVTKMVVLK